MTEPTSAIVLGAGGLLGSAVRSRLVQLGTDPVTNSAFAWNDAERFGEQVRAMLPDDPTRPVALLWCAGRGHVGASSQVLVAEHALLESLRATLIGRVAAGGRVRLVLASSAGAVWSGATRFPVTSATPACPRNPYGVAKLEQEQTVLALRGDGVDVRIARLSNLYGPGQRLDKPQGLLSHLVANAVANRPTQIFVPLDTARDYIHTLDAARAFVALATDTDADRPVRILATGRTHTIAAVVAMLGRILRRRVPLTYSIRPESRLQPRALAFRPDVVAATRSVPLEAGMRALITDRLAGVRVGALA